MNCSAKVYNKFLTDNKIVRKITFFYLFYAFECNFFKMWALYVLILMLIKQFFYLRLA